MEQQMKLTKQMIDLQKVAFDNMMDNMILFWNQTGQMLNTSAGQAAWLPDQGKGALRLWTEGNKKACEFVRTAVEDGYNGLGKFFKERPKYGY